MKFVSSVPPAVLLLRAVRLGRLSLPTDAVPPPAIERAAIFSFRFVYFFRNALTKVLRRHHGAGGTTFENPRSLVDERLRQRDATSTMGPTSSAYGRRPQARVAPPPPPEAHESSEANAR